MDREQAHAALDDLLRQVQAFKDANTHCPTIGGIALTEVKNPNNPHEKKIRATALIKLHMYGYSNSSNG